MEEATQWIHSVLEDWFNTFEHVEDFRSDDEDIDDYDEEEAQSKMEAFEFRCQFLLDKIKDKLPITPKEQEFMFYHLHQAIKPNLDEFEEAKSSNRIMIEEVE